MSTIRAGTMDELCEREGDWIIIDMGFASYDATCGVLVGGGLPMEITFSDAQKFVVRESQREGSPLNLVIEAPLSSTFREGNPVGRSFEKRGRETRYWYYGGVALLVIATGHILRAVLDKEPTRSIRLFEGFVSFKPNWIPTSHSKDVSALWNAILQPTKAREIVPPNRIGTERDDHVESSLKFAGMDFGIPPVVIP